MDGVGLPNRMLESSARRMMVIQLKCMVKCDDLRLEWISNNESANITH